MTTNGNTTPKLKIELIRVPGDPLESRQNFEAEMERQRERLQAAGLNPARWGRMLDANVDLISGADCTEPAWQIEISKFTPDAFRELCDMFGNWIGAHAGRKVALTDGLNLAEVEDRAALTEQLSRVAFRYSMKV
ncbi:MAG: hypothetical protein ACN6QT_06250 [Burkholderia contaminans]|uniref:hypothetical protein n=1 Tax=Burkholderia TaxID=32008 RepID=UPI000D00EA65|nr:MULTISPECIES: hypothetical protein [Burkholderia]MBD1412102.1 hypothetical protein [Burkholderia contaminans]MBH9669718.1 hypothetical protein [Burkholderia contaminans]MBH9676701.1 hypothetical protein [Burkholderia contaminans]MBH9707125.1 hypothetical protein [Burkholderia contaminans]MBH9720344.1 hypothetical protein [Burkholderia contaminans]